MMPAGPGGKYKSSFGKKPSYLHGNGSLGGGWNIQKTLPTQTGLSVAWQTPTGLLWLPPEAQPGSISTLSVPGATVDR